MMTYGAITPARDEEKFLPGLINSMLSQTRLPLRWIIIDDGSVDSTPRLVDDLASRHKWVTVQHVPRAGQRQPGGETALQRFLSPHLWSDCDVIFRVDADISFEPDFVHSMLAEFRRNPRLGVASGTLYERRRGEWQEVMTPRFHTRGAIKMYSRACLNAIGGVEPGLGWDTIDEARAAFLGFTTRSFRHIQARHHRPQGSAAGILRGRLACGQAAYQCGYSPLFMSARVGRQMLAWPPLIGALWMSAGYLQGYLRAQPRAASPELIKFIRRQQIRRLLLMKTVWI
ncbi:MAG: glycosyltransferase family 2 protein [Candidatus Binataceae bacterium]